MPNKIFITISEEAEKAILYKITELIGLLPDRLITLTEEERRGLTMMGEKTVQFVDKALDLTAQNPNAAALPTSTSAKLVATFPLTTR